METLDSTLTGFRLKICDVETRVTGSHWAGGNLKNRLDCPNCAHPMFSIFNLDFSAPELRELELWNEEYLKVLVCPNCPLYMEPYWIQLADEELSVIGGYRFGRDNGTVVETTYEKREIRLFRIDAEEYPRDEIIQTKYHNRELGDGIYHQIGGLPCFGEREPMVCVCCDNRMKFAGIVDYDDKNVPLYEEGKRPIALIIGDFQSLYFYTCRLCTITGFQFVI